MGFRFFRFKSVFYEQSFESYSKNSVKTALCRYKNHDEVADYLMQELEKLGLQPQIQEGTTLTEWGNLVKSKNILARIKGSDTSKALLLLSIVFFGIAHDQASYENNKAKPNSLVYFLNADKNLAVWTTYDKNLDEWTKVYLGENPKKANVLNRNGLFSKYNSAFTFMAKAPLKNIVKPTIVFLKDAVVGNQRFFKIRISPNRKVNRYDIFADEKMTIYNLKANHVKSISQKEALYKRTNKRVLSYYVVNNEPLELEFSIHSKSIFNMNLMESSFDLMNNPLFSMVKRSSRMMPTPFVLNDAVVIQQKINPSEQKLIPKTSTAFSTFDVKKDIVLKSTDTIKAY